MISYDLDPSLHTGEPEPQVLDDGFSPPHHGNESREPAPAAKAALAESGDPAHWGKSAF